MVRPRSALQAQEGANQRAGCVVQIAARAGHGSGGGGSRLGKVVFGLAAHAVDLLLDRRRQVLMSCGRHAPGFVREDGERRLEAVREVAGLRDRPRDGGFAVLEQEIQIVDQRLNLARVNAVEAAAASLAHV